MLITPSYRAMNAEMHRSIPRYGTSGHKWASQVQALAQEVGARTVLDYGCGKGTLTASLSGLKVFEYDPAIPGKDVLPESAGVVVCTDVMEHVEPEFTDEVVAQLCALATRAVFVVVCCVEGDRLLPDGRPAHINVHSREWWADTFRQFGGFEASPCGADEYAAVWRKCG